MKLRELLEDAKNNAPNLMTKELIQEFEEFAGSLNQFQSAKKGGSEELQALLEKMSASQDRLREYFIKVAASYGMTAEQLTEHVENAGNFNPADWEEIQANKRIIIEGFNIPAVKKRRNKNTKI